MNYEAMTFEELAKVPVQTILADYYDEGLRVLILRGPASVNAYIGIPSEHPLAGFGYDDISFISAHGGLTFAKEGNGDAWPKGYYWYGLDYAHAGDKSFFDLQYNFKSGLHNKEWTVPMVKQDIWSTLYDLKKMMVFAENIIKKYEEKTNQKAKGNS